MRQSIRTFMLTAATVGLSAGAAWAAGDTSASADTTANTGIGIEAEVQTPVGPDVGAQVGASADVDANAAASSEAQVESVQAKLAQEGHSVAVDGVWGPQTANALRQFQQANNLDATGEINAETLAAMNLDATASQGTAMGQ